MDEILKDQRFRHVVSDPRFRNVPKNERKVKIDRRFKAMFTDDKFKLDYTVDKRGRAVNQTQSDNLKKYYELSSSDEEKSENDNNEERDNEESPDEDEIRSNGEGTSVMTSEPPLETEFDVKKKRIDPKEDIKLKSKAVDSLHKGRMKEGVIDKLKDLSVDYARGIGSLDSDVSSSDESTSEDSEDEVVHPWGELDKDAEEVEEATTRLAACNLDWDRINAKDLFILFNSFLPSKGFIKSVTIYPSEYGLERLKEEELKGPKELFDNSKLQDFDDEDFRDKHSEGSEYCMEKLREYQLNRLRYYYAVVVFDSSETANKIYTECDGIEYESSATKMDLRFIPEEMEFDQDPKDSCSSMPDITKYKPRLFVNTALQLGKVNLTWDETDPNRVEFTKKLAGGGNINEDDLQAYVAASSDESNKNSSSEDEKEVDEEGDVKNEKDPISKYKALLSSVAADVKKHNVDMEVSWGVGLGDKDSGSDDGQQSDDDSPKTKKNAKRGHLKKDPKKLGASIGAEDSGENEGLELLLADDQVEEKSKAHFNFKHIQKQEQKSKKKKRKYQNDSKEEVEDKFEINVNDSRFAALYTSHQFNIDPADPRFVRTEATEKIIREKQKRRKLTNENKSEVDANQQQKMSHDLSSLVKSIKGKHSGS